jgi:hypothetical protein
MMQGAMSCRCNQLSRIRRILAERHPVSRGRFGDWIDSCRLRSLVRLDGIPNCLIWVVRTQRLDDKPEAENCGGDQHEAANYPGGDPRRWRVTARPLP